MQNLLFINEDLGINRIEQINKLLERCKTYPDSSNIYWSMWRLNHEYGKIKDTDNNMKEIIKLREKYYYS